MKLKKNLFIIPVLMILCLISCTFSHDEIVFDCKEYQGNGLFYIEWIYNDNSENALITFYFRHVTEAKMEMLGDYNPSDRSCILVIPELSEGTWNLIAEVNDSMNSEKKYVKKLTSIEIERAE